VISVKCGGVLQLIIWYYIIRSSTVLGVVINKNIREILMARKKNWKQKKHEEKVFGFRNWAAKHNKHKGGSHKSKKDYDRKSLVRKLKKFIKGL